MIILFRATYKMGYQSAVEPVIAPASTLTMQHLYNSMLYGPRLDRRLSPRGRRSVPGVKDHKRRWFLTQTQRFLPIKVCLPSMKKRQLHRRRQGRLSTCLSMHFIKENPCFYHKSKREWLNKMVRDQSWRTKLDVM